MSSVRSREGSPYARVGIWVCQPPVEGFEAGSIPVACAIRVSSAVTENCTERSGRWPPRTPDVSQLPRNSFPPEDQALGLLSRCSRFESGWEHQPCGCRTGASPPDLGSGSRRFESCHPHHFYGRLAHWQSAWFTPRLYGVRFRRSPTNSPQSSKVGPPPFKRSNAGSNPVCGTKMALRPYSSMDRVRDYESRDPGSNPGRASILTCQCTNVRLNGPRSGKRRIF